MNLRAEEGHVDRRFTQTQEGYAADDLEMMREARRYGDHLFALIRPAVGPRVIEIGCGIGTMSRRLVEAADSVLGIEPNPHCVTRAEPGLLDHPKFTLRTCHLEDCDPAELKSHRFTTVVCVNVLEHIEDDRRALSLFGDIVIPDGRVVIFVPAVQAAYGPLDAALGHHRRYSKRTLSQAFAAAGLDLLTIRYTNPIGLAGWLYNAKIRKSTEHSLAQIRTFERFIAPWALPIESMLPPPIGLSLIAIGRPRTGLRRLS